MFPLIPLVLAAAALPLANAAIIEHWWNISYVENTNPDQLFARRVIGVNGTWPPPPVSATQNDTLLLHVYNGLGDANTDLHHHGLFFNGTGYFDGAVSVTQCAIPPGDTLTYTINTNQQSGTYWIHGHYMGQYIDGLRTPFVIHPLTSPHVYDEDYTIVLGDWYHTAHRILIKQFLNKYNPTGAEPVPESSIMYIFPNNTMSADLATSIHNGSAVADRAVLKFEKGKTYRLRFINTGALAMFYFGIEGHQMRVIELDGVETQEYNATVVPISVAQRISVLVTARDDDAASTTDWALFANMNPDMFDTIPDILQMNITARITYSDGQQTLQPATIFDPAYPDFEELDLVPIEVEAQAPADVSHRLDAYFDTYDDGTNRASFNNITFQFPTVPSLWTQLTMGEDAYNSKVYGAQTHAIILNHLDNVEVTIYNWDAGLHPFHLHGHKFQLVQKNYDASTGIVMVENQVNPIRRDTVMVPPGGSVSIRFRADNPGAWLLHCHIEWHLESGLATVFIEAPREAQQKLQPPSVMFDQCKAQKIPISGNVVGKQSTTNFKGQPWGPFPQTHIIGWTPKAKGALAGTVLAALLGMLTVVWYSMGALDEHEAEEIQRRKFAAQQASGGKYGKVKGLFHRQQ